MILFNLVCAQHHEFEAWFRGGAAYEALAAAGEITCPFCGDRQVRKAPMAPSLVKSRRGEKAAAPAAEPAAPQLPASPAIPAEPPAVEAVRAALSLLRQHVESTCDNVGDRFPEEARRIHYGEAPERPIYGQATVGDARALAEEGVALLPLPWLQRQDS